MKTKLAHQLSLGLGCLFMLISASTAENLSAPKNRVLECSKVIIETDSLLTKWKFSLFDTSKKHGAPVFDEEADHVCDLLQDANASMRKILSSLFCCFTFAELVTQPQNQAIAKELIGFYLWDSINHELVRARVTFSFAEHEAKNIPGGFVFIDRVRKDLSDLESLLSSLVGLYPFSISKNGHDAMKRK